jgi:hypothetical protein
MTKCMTKVNLSPGDAKDCPGCDVSLNAYNAVPGHSQDCANRDCLILSIEQILPRIIRLTTAHQL